MTGASRLAATVTLALVYASSTFQTQAPAVASIVEQFYPQRLVDLAVQAGDEPVDRRQCHAVVNTQPSGAPRTIAAAYTNTSSAAVRVLQAGAGGAFQLVAEPPPALDLFGAECKISLVDLDQDSTKEILVTFGMMVSDVTWIFKWDGRELVNLTPTTPNGDGTLRTLFHNASVVDIDHDGVSEIFVVGQYPPPLDEAAKPDSLFKLSAGGYVQGERIVGLWEFERTAGAPELQRVPVSLPKGARGPYSLHVVSGEPGGTSRVTSAVVLVNERQVLGPSDFGDEVDIIDRDVTLSAENELGVRLAGAPGSKMLVIIRSRDWAQ